MKVVSPTAASDFAACNPKTFCRAYIESHCTFDVVTRNMVETFNGHILQARSMHLIDMLEELDSWKDG